MGVIINDHGGSQTAASEASNRFKGKLSVLCDASHLQMQFLFEFFNDLFTALDVAGRPKTYPDDMFSSGSGRKESIKRDDTVDLGGGEV